MAEDGEQKTAEPFFIKSTLAKQLAWDDKEGRFRETSLSEEDVCEPDDEFCVTDQDSGELVRLTQEEKERIFMDALQVRVYIYIFFVFALLWFLWLIWLERQVWQCSGGWMDGWMDPAVSSVGFKLIGPPQSFGSERL